MAKVFFKNISKQFGNQKVLDDFTLEIRDQEFLVLVGPSGCGKSTTLRVLSGLETVERGDLFIGDRCVNRIDPKDRDIAMVFQNYALYPHYSVYDNLAFGLKLRKFPKQEIRNRVMDVARLLQLETLLDRKPKALSGGQRQRVALGRAIVRNPKVFLMDEPLSNLDAKLRVQMRAELMRLQQKLKTTTLYVTHDQVEAMTMGDRIVVLNEGKIQQVGTPFEIYHAPQNKFVAGFMGSPPMNFLDRQALTIGVRPENIAFKRTSGEDWEIEGQFQMIEPLGAESLYHFKVQDAIWVVRMSQTHAFGRDQAVKLYVPQHKIFLFDNQNQGQTIPQHFQRQKAA